MVANIAILRGETHHAYTKRFLGAQVGRRQGAITTRRTYHKWPEPTKGYQKYDRGITYPHQAVVCVGTHTSPSKTPPMRCMRVGCNNIDIRLLISTRLLLHEAQAQGMQRRRKLRHAYCAKADLTISTPCCWSSGREMYELVVAQQVPMHKKHEVMKRQVVKKWVYPSGSNMIQSFSTTLIMDVGK